MNTPRHRTTQYVVYQDLNEPTTVFVARADEVIAGTFRAIAGPFGSRTEAEEHARETASAAAQSWS